MVDPSRNALIAIVGGVALFFLLFAPIAIIQQRRYGRTNVLRILGAAALSIYGVALVAYTLFPLPGDTGAVCAPKVQLIPFHFVADIARETAGLSLAGVVSSAAVLQVVFNIALFVPLGVIVRRYFFRGIVFAVLAGFAVSLLVESTQYTGIWGLYDCAFRLADVDDLIANTAGALVGALIAPLVLFWMPGDHDLRPRRFNPRPVTARRRWLGMLLDWFLFGLAGAVLTVPLVGVPQALGSEVPVWIQALLSTVIPAVVVFLIPALRGSGATFGQRAVWLAPNWGELPVTVGRRLLRASVTLAWAALIALGEFAPDTLLALIGGLAVPLALAELIAVGVTHGRGIGSRLARATFVDTRTPAP